jgi:tRNA nucleotidyltransferase/poly(A) polymerase
VDERIVTAVGSEPAWIVGGALRDELLGREIVDVDVACGNPELAARLYSRLAGGAVFRLSERHGAWRVARRDGCTVDFTPLRGDTVEEDLGTRDFTINAMARSVQSGDLVDPFAGRPDIEARRLRAVAETIFADDPLRLLRAVRLEDELGFRMDPEAERLVQAAADQVVSPAGERILGELERLSPDGFRRADELGLLQPLAGSLKRLDRVDLVDSPGFLLVVIFGKSLNRYPVSNDLKRFARTLLSAERPKDATPRELHRFRRRTEPWALSALAFLGATDLYDAVREAREQEPKEPLLRGDDVLELGVPTGPDVGRLLELVGEERAAGTISTREEALELVQRARGAATDAT